MTQTHFKKLFNPDYLGAYSLDPGKDMILTIKSVTVQTVTGPDNRKEECPVLFFVEPVKPMVLNVTNSKIIQKIYKTPFIEEWVGKKIQIYVDNVKAFGDVVEALRIRNIIPKDQTQIDLKCHDCSGTIVAFQGASAEQIAKATNGKYGVPVCGECAMKRKQAAETITADADPIQTELEEVVKNEADE